MCVLFYSSFQGPTNVHSLGSIKLVGLLKNNKHVHLNRWYVHIESLESTQLALASLIGENLFHIDPMGNTDVFAQRPNQTKRVLTKLLRPSRLDYPTPRKDRSSPVSHRSLLAICTLATPKLPCSINTLRKCTRASCSSVLMTPTLPRSGYVTLSSVFHFFSFLTMIYCVD